jgi:hypothetical protein
VMSLRPPPHRPAAIGRPASVDPGEGALDAPPAWQHDKRGLSGKLGDDLDGQGQV